MLKWGEENKEESDDFMTLAQTTKFNRHLQKELEGIAKQEKLNGLEYLKQVHVISEAFSEANDLMTPTLKLKRYQIREKYKDNLLAMY